jgi:two-component system LytT family response regulator
VDVDRIDRIEAEGNYLILSIQGVQRRVRETMQEFLVRANTPLFIRVHRSVAVNRRAVTGIEPFGKGTYVLVLRDGSRVMSSYSYRENVLALMRPLNSG